MGYKKWLHLCAPIFLTFFWRSRWCKVVKKGKIKSTQLKNVLIKKGQKHDKKLHKWFIEGALPGQAHCTAHPVCWPRACLLKPLQDLRFVFDIPIKVNKMKKMKIWNNQTVKYRINQVDKLYKSWFYRFILIFLLGQGNDHKGRPIWGR